MSVTANTTVLTSAPSGTIQPVLTTVQPISIVAAGGKITFNYAGYGPIVTKIFDPSSDWQTPKTMRLYFWTSGSNYSRATDLLNMRFSAGNIVTLPLEFISINSQTTGKDVNVSWTTANEVNTASFQVERSSDGISWRSVGTVPSVNQPGTQHYSYTDKNPPAGVLYYRVKAIDRDGKAQYSQITVVGRVDAKFSFYPNPVINTLVVNYPPVSAAGTLEIISADGRVLKTVQLIKGSASTLLNTQFLAAGFYFLRFNNGGSTVTLSFIKR